MPRFSSQKVDQVFFFQTNRHQTVPVYILIEQEKIQKYNPGRL
uniref:Uncharacterized protein n=1 Tax=Arundo donax TaxID=35708 RepID=A0A0A9BCJ3_ARUDO